MTNFSPLFEGKTPQEKKQLMDALMELGVLDDQDNMLQEQVARTQALQDRGAQNWGPGAAGPIGAGVDILGGILAARKQAQLRDERKGLLDKKRAGRKGFASFFDPSPYAEPPDVDRPRDFSAEPYGPLMEDGSFFRRQY